MRGVSETWSTYNMLVDKTVSVEKAPLDLIEKLTALVVAVKAAGTIALDAIPADIAALVIALPAIVVDCQAMPGAIAENKAACVKAVMIGAEEMVEAILA
jgi:hypothetical protein